MTMALTVCSSARADEPTAFYQALRQAFGRTLRDRVPAEADRLVLEIDLVTGETLQAMVERMFGSMALALWARWSRRRAGERPRMREPMRQFIQGGGGDETASIGYNRFKLIIGRSAMKQRPFCIAAAV